MMGELVDKDGTHLGFTDYKASDGITLQALYNDFGTPSEAEIELEKEIKAAAKVVEIGVKKNKEGTSVGRRAQIILRAPRVKWSAVLWTDGRSFHEIESRSLRDILELERIYRY